MEEIQNYSRHDLEQLPYRILQQIAKSMALPSNVKKVYLIELIYTKTHKTAEEVLDIVQRVKYERQVLSQTNRRKTGKKRQRLQATEVSSTNSACISPPINSTPKRAYSPEMPGLRSVFKCYPRPPLSPKNTSDRVLRSYNVKSYKRPNYSLLNNSVVELVKASDRLTSPREKETQISIVSHEGRLPRLNVTARCVMKKYRPAVYSPRSYLRTDNQLASINTQTQNTAVVPAKRVRTISGIYPIPTPETPLKTSYEFIQSIGFRRTDGRMSKINALVQKPVSRLTYNIDNFNRERYKNVEVTIQDIINSNIDSQTVTNPNISEYMLSASNSVPMALSDVMPKQRVVENRNEMNSFSVYYHKKIRAEQVRSKLSVPSLMPLPAAQTNPRRAGEQRAADRDGNTRDVTAYDNQREGNTAREPLPPAPRKAGDTHRLPTVGNAFRLSDSCDVIPPPYVQNEGRERIPVSGLPTIAHVFSRFNDSCDVMPPPYLQKDDGREITSNLVVPRNSANDTFKCDVTMDELFNTCDVTPPSHGLQLKGDEIEASMPTLATECKPATPQSAPATRHTPPHLAHIDGEEDKIKEPPSVPCKKANEHPVSNVSDVVCNLSEHTSDVTQPLYVQVSEEADRNQDYPKWTLEGLYNLKRDSTEPRVSNARATRCVYAVPTITTAVQLPLTAPEPYYPPLLEPASQFPVYGGTSDEVSRLCSFSTIPEQDMTLRRYHEALSTSTSSLESQTATIPEMVEDALEIISQDGDYMERIGMDVRMQCILCSWAGSKIILEYHIRKDHSNQIILPEKNEWNITYKLGSLVNQDVWLSHVCERDNTLYILSVKYEDPDCFMASLSTLSIANRSPKIGTITLYNKVSGEPFSWHGQIPQLPSNMPYENDPNCLKIELSKLELLPNSANIKLINRELVLNPPTKAVVGQPELNDIHIIIFVKIEES